MNDFRDPTVLHAAECLRCGTTYRDGDILNQYGECPICEAEREAEEALEEVNAAIDVMSEVVVPQPSYFGLAYDLTRR